LGSGWHQDRTIVVKQQRPVPGFGPWTVKNGLMHVSPPVEILAQMVTLRIHLDPVPPTNAPLLIACGTHRIGMVPEPEVDEVVKSLRLSPAWPTGAIYGYIGH